MRSLKSQSTFVNVLPQSQEFGTTNNIFSSVPPVVRRFTPNFLERLVTGVTTAVINRVLQCSVVKMKDIFFMTVNESILEVGNEYKFQ